MEIQNTATLSNSNVTGSSYARCTVIPGGQVDGTDVVLTNPYRKQETEEDATPSCT